MLISSHVLAEVAQTVDHVLVINRGRLVESASLNALAGALEDRYLELTAE